MARFNLVSIKAGRSFPFTCFAYVPYMGALRLNYTAIKRTFPFRMLKTGQADICSVIVQLVKESSAHLLFQIIDVRPVGFFHLLWVV